MKKITLRPAGSWQLATAATWQAIIKDMQFKFNAILLLLTVAALSGCGFALRGAADLPPALRTMALTSTDGNSDILRELRRSLIASNVSLEEEPRADGYVLVLGAEESSERVLSVNSNARAGEYELSVSVPFQLRNGNTVVMGPETLSVEKVYLADPNSAVAKAEERELMEGEMRRELVNRILQRLQSAPR